MKTKRCYERHTKCLGNVCRYEMKAQADVDTAVAYLCEHGDRVTFAAIDGDGYSQWYIHALGVAVSGDTIRQRAKIAATIASFTCQR